MILDPVQLQSDCMSNYASRLARSECKNVAYREGRRQKERKKEGERSITHSILGSCFYAYQGIVFLIAELLLVNLRHCRILNFH